MVCMLVINSQTYLKGTDSQDFKLTLLFFILFCGVGIFITFMVRLNLIDFVQTISSDIEASMKSEGHTNHVLNTESNTHAKKEKKELQIPEYLFRYSSTFFKTATKKDLLVKKFFNNDKKDTAAERMNVSQELNKNTTSFEGPKRRAHELKKTDLSLMNFKLDKYDNSSPISKGHHAR